MSIFCKDCGRRDNGAVSIVQIVPLLSLILMVINFCFRYERNYDLRGPKTIDCEAEIAGGSILIMATIKDK